MIPVIEREMVRRTNSLYHTLLEFSLPPYQVAGSVYFAVARPIVLYVMARLLYTFLRALSFS